MPRPAQVHGRRARQAGGDGELSPPTTLRGGRQRSEGSCGVEACVRRAVRLTAQLLAVTDVHLDAGELLGEVRQAAHHVAVTRADLAERAARLRVTTQSLPPLASEAAAQAPGCVANAKAALKQQRAARPDDPRNDRRLSGEAGRRLYLAVVPAAVRGNRPRRAASGSGRGPLAESPRTSGTRCARPSSWACQDRRSPPRRAESPPRPPPPPSRACCTDV